MRFQRQQHIYHYISLIHFKTVESWVLRKNFPFDSFIQKRFIITQQQNHFDQVKSKTKTKKKKKENCTHPVRKVVYWLNGVVLTVLPKIFVIKAP